MPRECRICSGCVIPALHLLATAVLEAVALTRLLDIGPPTDEGFSLRLRPRLASVSPDDFARLEEEMKKKSGQGKPAFFERSVKTRAEAAAFFAARGQNLQDRAAGRYPGRRTDLVLSEWRSSLIFAAKPPCDANGKHQGLQACSESPPPITGGMKRTHSSNELQAPLFPTKPSWTPGSSCRRRRKNAITGRSGARWELFTFDEDVGPGLVLWMPKGGAIIEELRSWPGKRSSPPDMSASALHARRESMAQNHRTFRFTRRCMYPAHRASRKTATRGGGRGAKSSSYYLKPMNCPHHHKIFAAVPRSYRDLPLRLAEYGACYRYEQSGELLGLMRVRCMLMNDAHIYCSPEQFAAEFRAVNDMYLNYFKIFGIEKYQMRFSTHDPKRLGEKFVNEPELWLKTEAMVRQVLDDSGINYVEVANEAAFYGPKIDAQVWSAIGREFTIATNQVDFAVPGRCGLVYKTRENTDATPLCIHRAQLGTHERFIAFLIEHYAGNFPLWLAPEQVRVLPIGEDQLEYGRGVVAELRGHGVRAELDDGSDKIGAKIRHAEMAKVHTMLIAGGKEQGGEAR